MIYIKGSKQQIQIEQPLNGLMQTPHSFPKIFSSEKSKYLPLHNPTSHFAKRSILKAILTNYHRRVLLMWMDRIREDIITLMKSSMRINIIVKGREKWITQMLINQAREQIHSSMLLVKEPIKKRLWIELCNKMKILLIIMGNHRKGNRGRGNNKTNLSS